MPEPVSIVIPTIGRATLTELLTRLHEEIPKPEPREPGPAKKSATPPVEIIVVDDRPEAAVPLQVGEDVVLTRGPARGPAAARNAGWHAAEHPWVVFMDDDVLPAPGWWKKLQKDLKQPPDVAGVQARISVPLPDQHEITDWERNTSELAKAQWITADMAYRRSALETVGGFDERFPSAYREDADLAYRISCEAGLLIVGERMTTHPVRVEGPWKSLETQRGNADDALLRRRYGRDWQVLLAVPPGRRPKHALIVASAVAAAVATAAGRTGLARLATLGWLAGTAEFAYARLRNAPGEGAHPVRLITTSVLIPPLAIGHWLAGWVRYRTVIPYSIDDDDQDTSSATSASDHSGEPVFRSRSGVLRRGGK